MSIFLTIGNEYSFEYCDARELLMGGPWAGKLSINSQIVEGEFLALQPILSNSEEKLLLGSYHFEGKKIGHRFRIVVLTLMDWRAFESYQSFRALCFETMDDSTINFFKSIDPSEVYRDQLLFSEENFHEIEFDFSFMDKPPMSAPPTPLIP